jgi:protein-S-isoprenylcysteine O-methyltransferase
MGFDPVDLVRTHLLAVAVTFVLGVYWIAAEYVGRRATWRRGAPRRPSSALDRGTYPVIAASLALSMSLTVVAFLLGIGGYLPVLTIVPGAILVLAGMGIRVWALDTLGRFFTMPITIHADHRIVRDGPYRWIRHPAYTGGFLTAVGLPLALGTPLGVLASLAFCGAAYVYRIRIEEAALVGRFGDDYRRYAKGTWRLLPGIY